MQAPIPRRFPRQAPYPIRISPSFLACSEYLPSDTYATRTHKPNCNHYRPTPHPRGGYTPHLPYTNLLITHKPITVHTLALSKEEGEGGARPPRPQLLPATHPPVLKPLNLDSSPLYSTPLPYNKTTLPLLIIGDCRLVQQHPLSLPTRGFRNNGGLDLSGLGVLALPPRHPPTPLTSRYRWTAAGSHPIPGTMICADF